MRFKGGRLRGDERTAFASEAPLAPPRVPTKPVSRTCSQMLVLVGIVQGKPVAPPHKVLPVAASNRERARSTNGSRRAITAALLLWRWVPSLSDVNFVREVKRPGTDACVVIGVGSGERRQQYGR
jgi:hypothetical protein